MKKLENKLLLLVSDTFFRVKSLLNLPKKCKLKFFIESEDSFMKNVISSMILL